MMNSLTFVTYIFLDIFPNIGVTGIIFTIIFPLPKIFSDHSSKTTLLSVPV